MASCHQTTFTLTLTPRKTIFTCRTASVCDVGTNHGSLLIPATAQGVAIWQEV